MLDFCGIQPHFIVIKYDRDGNPEAEVDTDLILLIFYTFYLLLQLGFAAHILLTRHEESSSALMWLLVIVLLPVAGIIIYCFFGIIRIKTVGLRIQKIQDFVDSSKNKYLGRQLESYLDNLKEFIPGPDCGNREVHRMLDHLLPARLPLSGNRLELLRDGTGVYPRMLEDIRKAEHSIRMQSFIIMNDPVGRTIFDALEEQAKKGVDVKVQYDSFGSFKASFSYFFHRYVKRKLSNLSIRPFSPFNLLAPWRIQLRNHRKLLVIDGKIAYTGGINISQDNTRLPRRKHIHDLHCRITGPAVAQFQMAFLKDWVYSTRSKLVPQEIPHDFPPQQRVGDSIVRVVDSGPGQNYQGSQNVFYTAAAAAQKSLWILTPYFVPDHSYIMALSMTAARGVDVRIIVPQNNNHPFVALASQSFYRSLLSAGIKVFEKKGNFSHAKAMLVDHEWAFMGSSNCDIRSFRLNFELDFCVEQGEFIADLKKQFDEELAAGKAVKLKTVTNKNVLVKLRENFCALFAPIL
ncbi:MAG: cardiolipin synthase [Victivallaceae bacterium]|nr:cardiolipin synthase [Victivallaceae bacterium]